MKTYQFKTYGILQRQSLEGSTQPSKPHSRKIPNVQANLTPKGSEERTTNKVYTNIYTERRQIIKVRTEINEIENRRTTEEINKTRSWFFERTGKIDKLLARLFQNRKDPNY